MDQEYRFCTYWKEELTSSVIVSADHKTVTYTMYSEDRVTMPYYFDNPTVEQIYDFLESRCMPKERTQLPYYLESLGLTEYNPWEIVKVTHGVMWEDFLWLKFPGETITWDEVKVRD